MNLNLHIINAFTDKPFAGNPAGVVVLDSWLDDTLMQAIASQNNLSETAFLVKDNNNRYHIRWFSPLCEIDFCGHATLASAFVLFRQLPEHKTLDFFAKAVGDFSVCQLADGSIQMDFPQDVPLPIETVPTALLAGLSITPDAVYQNRQAYLVLYDSVDSVLNVERDNEQLKQLAPYDLMVTAQPKPNDDYAKYDFISRYFWPANGGDEDPVTGSAHTGLAPFWAQRLGKNTLLAHQASKRGGDLICTVTDGQNGDRVLIAGKAMPYLTGVIEV